MGLQKGESLAVPGLEQSRRRTSRGVELDGHNMAFVTQTERERKRKGKKDQQRNLCQDGRYTKHRDTIKSRNMPVVQKDPTSQARQKQVLEAQGIAL